MHVVQIIQCVCVCIYVCVGVFLFVCSLALQAVVNSGGLYANNSVCVCVCMCVWGGVLVCVFTGVTGCM